MSCTYTIFDKGGFVSSLISMIVAVDKNNGIGFQNDLLFNNKADMKKFVEVTKGKSVIMGYKTWRSLPKPILKGRDNIVLVSGIGKRGFPSNLNRFIKRVNAGKYHIPDGTGFQIATDRDLDRAFLSMSISKTEYVVIGGASLYSRALKHTDKIYMTRFNEEKEADTFFPEVDFSEWNLLNQYDLDDGVTFSEYKRK